jgi:ArsR family transcriptional regulator
LLAEPARLRLMSVLASDPDGANTAPRLAHELGFALGDVSDHLAQLTAAGLIRTRPGPAATEYALSAEAWVRFGRLLAGKPPHATRPSSGVPAISELPTAMRRTAERLAARYHAHFSRETVEKYLAESYELLNLHAKPTKHLPSLASQFAGDRLDALATASGFDLTATPEVLFVCVRNSGRSQIAAGILRQLAGDRVTVRTAGSQPASSIDGTIIDALDEIGVPVVSEFPKPLTDEVVQAADIVITMGCGDACPVYPGRRYLDWPIDDPFGKPAAEVRAIRDDIQRRVEALMEALGLEAPTTT